jgi:hypothetical protein
MFVPVVDKTGKPLMPTSPGRARRWIKRMEATPFFKKGIFCVRLNREPSFNEKQDIAVGIDPGSKKEGFTIKSEAYTFLNIQVDAVQYVKEAIETRRNMRRSRRSRKTPCRQNRKNRIRGGLPPSTKTRWQWKLRIINQLIQIFPITDFVVEDVCAISKKGKKKWNVSFSPLEVGKNWFYEEIKKHGNLHLKKGFETAELRKSLGLIKSKSKLSDVFEAHCIDSWVLANWYIGGHNKPDNKEMIYYSPIRLHRRQLHVMVPLKGGKRKLYGGTRSCGFKRGSLVKHSKYGLSYVGGTMNGRISLHSIKTGERLCQNAKPQDIDFLSYNAWKFYLSSR